MNYRLIPLSLILFGIGLSISGYLVDRSLCLDEAFIALNLFQRDYQNLLNGLDHNQVAPILFLLVEKLLFECFNHSDYALRALPLLSFIACLILTYIVTKQLVGSNGVPITAVCLLSLAPIFNSYSHELKPYMSDAFITLLLIYISLRFQATWLWLLVLALSGIFAIFVSYTSVIILATTGVFLLTIHRGNFPDIFKLLIVVICWLCAFLVNYLFFIQQNIGDPYLQSYWGS